MSGRFIQLGRQLRKLRTIVGGSPSAEPATTLRRATQLACDLACEFASVLDAQAAFHDLSERGLLEPALAARMTEFAIAVAKSRDEGFQAGSMTIGRDLDRVLRSLEAGAPVPDAAFDPLVPREPVEGAEKPDSVAAVVISGRVLELDVRAGRAVVNLDTKPLAMTFAGEIAMTFVLAAAPTSKPEVHHDATGITRVSWIHEKITVALAADLARADVTTTLVAP